MNLYLANGTYVGTQADARRLDKGFSPVTVPTDKDGLIAYLNGLAPANGAALGRTRPQAAERHVSANGESAAERALASMDAPGINVDQIVETILKAKGYALGRFAKAVSVRFEQMGG